MWTFAETIFLDEVRSSSMWVWAGDGRLTRDWSCAGTWAPLQRERSLEPRALVASGRSLIGSKGVQRPGKGGREGWGLDLLLVNVEKLDGHTDGSSTAFVFRGIADWMDLGPQGGFLQGPFFSG